MILHNQAGTSPVRSETAMRFNGIPTPAIRRLSLYLRQFESFRQSGQQTVSSRQLGQALGITDAQVRKDLAYFGQFGQPGVGYRVVEMVSQLRSILGTDKLWNVILVGAGNLGAALLQYKGFVEKGFRIVAAFDTAKGKLGRTIGGVDVFDLDQLERVIRAHNVRLAILATPAEAAESLCAQLTAAGVRGILNFAPVSLPAGPSLAVNAVDLAVQLEQLSYQVNVMDS